VVTDSWRTLPLLGWRSEPNASEPLKVSKLMMAYLALGAIICGEPALDREFGPIFFDVARFGIVATAGLAQIPLIVADCRSAVTA